MKGRRCRKKRLRHGDGMLTDHGTKTLSSLHPSFKFRAFIRKIGNFRNFNRKIEKKILIKIILFGNKFKKKSCIK